MRELVIHYSMTMYNIEHFRCVVEARENKRMIICISAYMTVWQTCVHTAAFEEDLSYMAFVHQWQVLVKAPVLMMFIHMSENPLHSLKVAKLMCSLKIYIYSTG